MVNNSKVPFLHFKADWVSIFKHILDLLFYLFFRIIWVFLDLFWFLGIEKRLLNGSFQIFLELFVASWKFVHNIHLIVLNFFLLGSQLGFFDFRLLNMVQKAYFIFLVDWGFFLLTLVWLRTLVLRSHRNFASAPFFSFILNLRSYCKQLFRVVFAITAWINLRMTCHIWMFQIELPEFVSLWLVLASNILDRKSAFQDCLDVF